MLFLPSAYHSALIQNWLRSLLTTSCRKIMRRRCYTCNAVMKPCFMNYFSMPAPSSSTPSPHKYGKPVINFNQVWSNCKLCANPKVLSFITVWFLYNFLLQGWKSSSLNFCQSSLCNEPRKFLFLFSFFLCCYSNTLEYGHHLEAVQDAYRLQLKLFLSEVQQQQLLSSIWSFLKLYTTISIAKLTSFMDVDEQVILTLLYSFINMKRELHLE